MSIISIRRYLDAARERFQERAAEENCLPFCGGLLEILGAREQEPLGEWARLLAAWQTAERGAECLAFRERALRVAARDEEVRTESRRREAADMRSILTMLNETLLCFASGSGRGVDRLLRVQTEINAAAQLDDVLAIRARLAETTCFIRDEMIREREENARTTRELQEKFGQARTAILRTLPGMPGREEAIEAMKSARQDVEGGGLAVVAARLERFEVLSERFGPAVWEDLFLDFARSAPREAWRDNVYRWTPATLVWMTPFGGDIDLLRAALDEGLTAPHEYQTVANGRRVRLSLPVRWMCGALLEQPADALVEQVDRLSGTPVTA